MRYRQNYADPYLTMLRQSERTAIAYGLIAIVALVIAFLVARIESEGAGQLAPLVGQVRYAAGVFMLFASGVSGVVSLWSTGRYAYYLRWPERFEYPT